MVEQDGITEELQAYIRGLPEKTGVQILPEQAAKAVATGTHALNDAEGIDAAAQKVAAASDKAEVEPNKS